MKEGYVMKAIYKILALAVLASGFNAHAGLRECIELAKFLEIPHYLASEDVRFVNSDVAIKEDGTEVTVYTSTEIYKINSSENTTGCSDRGSDFLRRIEGNAVPMQDRLKAKVDAAQRGSGAANHIDRQVRELIIECKLAKGASHELKVGMDALISTINRAYWPERVGAGSESRGMRETQNRRTDPDGDVD